MDYLVKELADRAAVADAIHTWCTAIDTRDWQRMRGLLSDPVHIDYSSNGSISGDMPCENWINRLKGLYGFDATLHMVSNLVIVVEGDRATCTSYVNAMHFLTEQGRELNAYACGTYIHKLSRAGDGWKITSATFRLAGRHSGHKAFDEAFVRARELAPEREPK
ncbi:MAG: nuclear transport factor 2 family protein [Alphaproteobacteria bacterium]|mgnify:CR=1 FL=1|nr:nuclear transport factor 2 family protein [Alphaproteobacteria bacterium]